MIFLLFLVAYFATLAEIDGRSLESTA